MTLKRIAVIGLLTMCMALVIGAQSTLAATSTTTVKATKTYTNKKFDYSVKYPKGWKVEKEKSIVDTVNKIESLVSIVSKDKKSVFRVVVNGKEKMTKFEALERIPVVIDGTAAIAYMFPGGYECGMASPGAKDCSFFYIPIYRNGKWYELHAIGNAESIEGAYKEILSTFKFAKKKTPILRYEAEVARYPDALRKNSVAFFYDNSVKCDTSTGAAAYKIETGDGASYAADCKGVVDHRYTKPGTYKAKYTKNAKTIGSVTVKISSE